MNTEQKFQELHHQLDRLDTSAAQARIEARLRLAWAEQHSTQPDDTMTIPTTSNRWRRLQLALGGAGLVTLALITVLAIPPTYTPAPTGLQISENSLKTKEGGLFAPEATRTADSDTSGSVTDGYEEYVNDDLVFDSEVTQPSYSYTDDTGVEQQLFAESVALSIDVKGDVLDTMHSLRTAVSNLKGQLVNISYYDKTGTVDVRIPMEQLSSFEDTLKQLDANQSVEVNSYNVANVSDEAEAAEGAARADIIAEHSFVNVQITIQPYQSFWSGNYTQYDRSTFTGQIKYELGKAIYGLIRSTGKLTRFVIWLIVYSAIFVPLFWLLRALFRKLISKLRKV